MPNLKIGGAEKVVTHIINKIPRHRYIVKLALCKEEGELLHFLKQRVEIINMNTRIRYSIINIFRLLKKEKPDIIFTSIGELNSIIALIIPFFRKVKFVARETNIVSFHVNNFFLKILYKRFYNLYDKIIAQSEDMYKDLLLYNIDEYKIYIINNFINKNNLAQINELEINPFDKNFFNVITVGRFSYQKGYDTLLKYLKNFQDKSFKFYFIGYGDDEEKLISFVNQCNLQENIFFLGKKLYPIDYINRCDLFILSSRYEGFPNVILEALSIGIPVLSSNCLGGINEIIIEGFNGYIYDLSNPNDLYDKLVKCKFHNFNRENIIEDVNRRFNYDTKLDEYIHIIDQLL